MGLRHDAGDGRTGTGAEVGGELSYTDPYNWLTLDTQGRVLLGHNGGYDDWGIGAIFTLKPTPGGQGLALRLTPTYGQTVTNTAQTVGSECGSPDRHGRGGPGPEDERGSGLRAGHGGRAKVS